MSATWPEARRHASRCAVQWGLESPTGLPEVEFVRRGFDKRGWPRGPWDDEPDLVVFASPTTPRLRCLVLRDAETGALCGYVQLPKRHPLASFDVKEARVKALRVLNGVSLADTDPSGHWLFGFTSSVVCDYCPAFKAHMLYATTEVVRRADLGEFPNAKVSAAAVAEARRRLPELRVEVVELYDVRRDRTPLRPKYHRYALVRAETEKLAAQLAAMVHP